MAEITANSSKQKKGFSKSVSRRSTRVDLTPMVDLGFLLITFFVFTTSLAEAKTLELIEPYDGDSKPVKESAAMTFLLGKNHAIYYYEGKFDENLSGFKMKETNFKDVRGIIMDKKRRTDSNYLMYIIKADTCSTLGDNIDLLDEMAICKIEAGHYAEMDISDAERSQIKKLK